MAIQNGTGADARPNNDQGHRREADTPDEREPSVFTILNYDGDTALHAAAQLSALCSWIETARSLTDAVSCVAAYDEAFAARLKRAEIPYNGADWNDDLSGALVTVHHIVLEKITTAREAVQKVMEKDRQGRAGAAV